MGVFGKIKRGFKKSAKRNVLFGRVTLAGSAPTKAQKKALASREKKHRKRTKSVIKKLLY